MAVHEEKVGVIPVPEMYEAITWTDFRGFKD